MPKIPKHIQDCWREYYGEPFGDEAVAIRDNGDDFYAVLCKDSDEAAEYFHAVVFNYRQGWEVIDDGIEFESVKAFQDEKIGPTFF